MRSATSECSPQNSDGGETNWASVEEKLLRDVSKWLSSADLRRARLVCKPWLAALATLSTKATTPPEPSTVTKWKAQLETMVLAMPCLQHLTIGSKLSSVGAQQLGVLAGALQLRAINIPYGQALQDRSLQALQPMAPTLKDLHIRGAASLSQRALLMLSVLGNLEVLELRHCGKVSWAELQDAWRMACLAYEAQAAEAASPNAGLSSAASSHSVASKLGGWLPGGGRLFRTSSPCSSSIQSALVKQKSVGSSLLARMARKSQAGPGAAAVAAAQLGSGAVGNGRSSSGGGSQDMGAVRKLLYRKQKQKMIHAGTAGAGTDTVAAAAAAGPGSAVEQPLLSGEPLTVEAQGAAEVVHAVDFSGGSSSRGSGSHDRHHHSGWSITSTSSSSSSSTFTTSASTLYRVGSLVWQGTTAAAAALSSGSSIARQSSAVQSALLAYLAEAEAAADLCSPNKTAAGSGGDSSPFGTITGSDEANDQGSSDSTAGSGMSRFSLNRRRPSASDKPLPAMPFTKLLSLSFTCSEVTLKNPGAELAAVAALTTLTSLEMAKCKLPDAVLWRLSSLTRLKKLKLSGLWSMGDQGMSELAKLTMLKNLAVSEAMHVTASGLAALSQLTSLTSLSLGLTQDHGPGVLGRLVHSLRSLQCVEVTASCWCDVDCELLADAAAAPNIAAAAAAATAAAAAAAQQVQQTMLWNLPAAASMSSSSSSKLLAPAPLSASSSRSNSSHNLRAPSTSSLHSFGSFSSYILASAPAGSSSHPSSSALQQQPQQLLVLKLHGCSILGHAGMAALKRLTSLQALVLDCCKNIHAAELLSQDLLPPRLTALSLRSLPFGNAFSGCVNVPACSSRLVKLELASLSSAHCGQLRRVLSFFPKLQELSLAGSVDIGDAVMRHMPLLPKLQQLDLSGTRVTSQGLEQLLCLSELRSLSVKGCNLVTDAGLQLLEAFPALEVVDLSECAGVSERGLLAVMLGAPRLVKLDVCGCKGASRELEQCCPHYLHLRHSL